MPNFGLVKKPVMSDLIPFRDSLSSRCDRGELPASFLCPRSDDVHRREYELRGPRRFLGGEMPSEFASQIAASRHLAEIKIGRELTI